MNESATRHALVQKTANPIVAIGVAIALSLAMVGITFWLFVDSSAYETVRQLHSQSLVTPVDLGLGVDTTSPVKAADIDDFGDKIEQRARVFNDSTEFDTTSLSNEALGL